MHNNDVAGFAVAGFDWDNGNTSHCQKHGVSCGEIEEMFFNGPAVFDDPHVKEKRFRAIGQNDFGRFMYVVFMLRKLREKTSVRPISARYMHPKEVEKYEKAQKI